MKDQIFWQNARWIHCKQQQATVKMERCLIRSHEGKVIKNASFFLLILYWYKMFKCLN